MLKSGKKRGNNMRSKIWRTTLKILVAVLAIYLAYSIFCLIALFALDGIATITRAFT